MNNITLKNVGFLSVLLLALFLIPSATLVKAVTFAPISRQLGVGSSGNDVTNLQTFFASNSFIYPEARVTGYYGALTAKAVGQFQINYGLPVVGNVGPLTLARINSVINSGYGIDISAPVIGPVSLQRTNASVQISWTTNELATGKVYYSLSPFILREATTSFQDPIISGSVLQATGVSSTQSVTIPNLQSSTQYYYMVVATDLSENSSVVLPSTVTTNP